MISETVPVIRADERFLWVRLSRQSACGGCSAAGGCGTGALARYLGGRMSELRLPNRLSATAGDQLRLGLDERRMLVAACGLYLPPLLGLLAGAVLPYLLAVVPVADREGQSLLFAFAGFLFGLILNRHRLRHADPETLIRQMEVVPAASHRVEFIRSGKEQMTPLADR